MGCGSALPIVFIPRIIKCLGLEETSKTIYFQLICCRQGCQFYRDIGKKVYFWDTRSSTSPSGLEQKKEKKEREKGERKRERRRKGKRKRERKRRSRMAERKRNGKRKREKTAVKIANKYCRIGLENILVRTDSGKKKKIEKRKKEEFWNLI